MELQKKKEALRQGIGGGPADIPTDVPMIAPLLENRRVCLLLC
jgi:hypothetical protein